MKAMQAPSGCFMAFHQLVSNRLGLVEREHGFAVGAHGCGGQGGCDLRPGLSGAGQAEDQPGAAFVDHPEATARDVLTGHGDVVARLNAGDGGGVPDGAADVDA